MSNANMNTCPICTEPMASHAKVCEEHQAMIDQDYIALVGIANNFRTGSIAHLDANVFLDLFQISPPPEGYCFVEETVIAQINEIIENGVNNGDQNQAQEQD